MLYYFHRYMIIFLSIVGYDFESSIHPDSINGSQDTNHLLGIFGAYIAYYLVEYTMGIFSIVFPIIFLMIAYAMFFKKEVACILSEKSR